MTPINYSRFIRFLQDDLSLSPDSIAMAERANHPAESQHKYLDASPVSMTLWQYGLVTLEQLDKIFDWLETA
ncbi:conserved hypothetical protein [Planktothrix serta PCC 8927]|uniref:DUF2949 domain-containing protein n=1 Tax=Planktothrix serta PCC 8927 TaxID=671068 RepID=A0A7Z9BHK0_9CYAN|nr:DUF2949 domain-containing protein [Planktothrix serta]VXD13433.1 conserved hypothetical protein [Planktothrix serta PCC 8927]